ncbi:MAG: hypothetical protein A2Z95_00445 [Gallionellales bacterium GWA2_60_18]|nr:MAG: hypothetical protein A2Z95_00445 [Gallionellales bacterium GWA2_60_18]
MRFSDIKLQWKMMLVVAVIFLPAMAGGTLYFFNQIYSLQVKSSLGGLMNFVDAKQQGVIRFIGQNEKFAKQMASLATDTDPVIVRKHFAKVVETDVFKQADHPFKDEIASGKRKIDTWRAYHAIDLVKDGKIAVSSDPAREGRDWTQKIDTKHGYSDVWKDGDTPVLSFAAEAGASGTIYVHADARMLTLIVNGEIGNLEGDMGTFYLAGVGATFDYYIVNKDNVMITSSRRHDNAILNTKGSEFPWQATQQDRAANIVCSSAGTYTTNAQCTTGCREAMGFYPGTNGKTMMGASMPFYDSGWTIVVEQEKDEMMGPFFTLGYTILILGSAVGLGAFLLFSYVARKHIVNPLKKLTTAIESMSRSTGDFDLTVKYDTKTKEELGAISRAFDHLITSFGHTVEGIRKTTETLSSTIEEVEETGTKVSAGSHAQSDAAASTAAAVEQISVTTTQIADLARETNTLAERDLNLSNNGRGVAEKTAQDMARVADLVAQSSQAVTQLNQKSEHIGGIVKVIKEIADQTNLLALNAAIEAARAGEQGRGFAVVADEVRKLAERTGKATTEIQELIDGMRVEVEHTAQSMNTTREETTRSLDLVGRVRDALEEIGHGAKETAAKVSDIAAATHEQDAAIQNIAQNVENISSMAEKNTSATERATELAHALRSLGEQLQQGVARFKL